MLLPGVRVKRTPLFSEALAILALLTATITYGPALAVAVPLLATIWVNGLYVVGVAVLA